MGRDGWTKALRYHSPCPRPPYRATISGFTEGYSYGFVIVNSHYAIITNQPVLTGPIPPGPPRQLDHLDTLLHFDLPTTVDRISYSSAWGPVSMGMAC